jgi:phosphoribosylformylglycinamidine cyclo-ligase
MSGQTYESAGVRGQEDALSSVSQHLGPTLELARGAKALTSFGHYASVLKVSDDLGIAISTDGVGTKTLVAAALDRYDTIGFDCMAMNVNDVLCVGARPIALVDYIGVHELDARKVDEILRGLGAAAKEAGVAVPGGELAQLPEIIGHGHLDLVGTCIGTVHPDRLVLGQAIEPGDAIVGIASSGIHSNGLTLARRVLLGIGGYRLEDEIGRLGRTLGEELLQPTEIYVRGVRSLWAAGIETRGLAHVTGDGLTNLCRLQAEVGYAIETMLPIPEIFALIADVGDVQPAEMYRVFNMGIGFVVITSSAAADGAVSILTATGYRAARIGTVSERSHVVEILPAGLRGGVKEGSGYLVRSDG